MENTSTDLRAAIQESNKRLQEQGITLMSDEDLKEILKSRGLVSFTPMNFGKELKERIQQYKEKT